jgi:hypothetical protein
MGEKGNKKTTKSLVCTACSFEHLSIGISHSPFQASSIGLWLLPIDSLRLCSSAKEKTLKNFNNR